MAGTVDPAVVVNPGRDDPAELIAAWRRAAAGIDPASYWQAHVDAGIGAAALGSSAFPAPLADDDDPPGVVFWQGDLDHLAGVRAAVVGTRRATRYGLDVAHELGRRLAASGIAVVSGLALGIDGAAHAGALAAEGAPPIAVVGCGLDRIYPREHGPLWRQVARTGVVLSEYPLGAPAAAWQFPARNRLIAALADVVVVVESQATGGAMGTAVEAARRGVPVLAVPGPVTAASSDGTNQLLFDGCSPARDADDVLLALGREPARIRKAAERRPKPAGDAETVLGHTPWGPVSVETLALGHRPRPGSSGPRPRPPRRRRMDRPPRRLGRAPGPARRRPVTLAPAPVGPEGCRGAGLQSTRCPPRLIPGPSRPSPPR